VEVEKKRRWCGKIVGVCIFCLTFSLEKCIYRSVNSEGRVNKKGGLTMRKSREERFGYVDLGNIRIYNTTPHPIKIVNKDMEVVLEIPKATDPLRMIEDSYFCGIIGEYPLFKKSFIAVDLPIKEENTYYIVSLPIAQIFQRDDLLVPHDLVRDDNGNVIGCKGFAFID